jgi:hypothetical protein
MPTLDSVVSHHTTPNQMGLATIARNAPNWNMMASRRELAGCGGVAAIPNTHATDHTTYRPPKTPRRPGFATFLAETSDGDSRESEASVESPQSKAGSWSDVSGGFVTT